MSTIVQHRYSGCMEQIGALNSLLDARMKPWNPTHLREGFLFTAQSAEQYMLECKAKAANRDTYKMLHDEHLAKFYVFNYLQECASLGTQNEFVAVLRSLLDMQPHAPDQAFDKDRFLAYRQGFITSLLREVVDS